MPEGPEAHVIAQGLNTVMKGRIITKIEVLIPNKAKGLSNLFLPSLVTKVAAYGKRPIIFTRQGNLVCFLSLSGRWSVGRKSNSSVVLTLQSGFQDGMTVLDYLDLEDRDQETVEVSFSCNESGYLEYVVNLDSYFSNHGHDWLTSPPSLEHFNTIVRTWPRQQDIVGKFLLDPKCNATVGNYLKSEILYKCLISPHRTVSSLTDHDVSKIYSAILELSNKSYKLGGFSIQHYFKVDGEKGEFKCLVYSKKLSPEGKEVVKETLSDNRVTYWVPSLQI